jgi:hypothetical protein
MSARAPQPDPAPPPAAFRELALFLAKLAAVLLLAAVCTQVPLVVSVLVSPWLGVLLAAGAFWVWGRLGPRPYPGLLPGCLCLWGFAAILGSFIACLILAVRELFV